MQGGHDFIERLKKKLYARSEAPGEHERSPLHLSMSDITPAWKTDEPRIPTKPNLSTMQNSPRKHTALVILLAALLFFVISLSVAAFVYLRGANLVSSDNIDLEIVSPSLIDGGKEATLQILIRNNNATPLRLADLILDYPEGTRSASDITKPVTSAREYVGDIAAGAQVKKTSSAILFGEEGSSFTIRATLEYRVEGSNAIFVKEGTITLVIGSSPVNLSVEGPEEAISGKELEFLLTITSNATTPIPNAVLEAEYPFGWRITGASPETSLGDTLWQIGDLDPEGKVVIRLKGTLEGTDEEERVFRFSVGSQDDPTDARLEVPLVTIPHSLVIKRPFVSGTLSLDGSSAKTVAVYDGRDVHGIIEWRNNLQAEVYDLEIAASFQGLAYDKGSVIVARGFWRSQDATMLWDKTQDPSLARIAPGAQGNVEFTFTPKALSGGSIITNPEMNIDVELRAKRFGQGDVPESISSALMTRVVLASPLSFAAKLLRFDGAFANRGPLPPKADQETTYTVLWRVENPSNTLAGARVTTTLPPSTKFIAAVSPSTEDVSFNVSQNTVTWAIGELRAGTKREVSFQIAFTPSVSQVGSTPQVLTSALFTGEDRFAGVRVDRSHDPLTTRFAEDRSFQNGMEVVQQ